jgi:hypothetical protein
MDREEKLKLLKKMGLKPSPYFEQTREKVFRPGQEDGHQNERSQMWMGYDGISDSSVKKHAQLAKERNRKRRK